MCKGGGWVGASVKMRLERKAGLLSWCIEATVSTELWIPPAASEEVGRADDGQRWKRYLGIAPEFTGWHGQHNCPSLSPMKNVRA